MTWLIRSTKISACLTNDETMKAKIYGNNDRWLVEFWVAIATPTLPPCFLLMMLVMMLTLSTLQLLYFIISSESIYPRRCSQRTLEILFLVPWRRGGVAPNSTRGSWDNDGYTCFLGEHLDWNVSCASSPLFLLESNRAQTDLPMMFNGLTCFSPSPLWVLQNWELSRWRRWPLELR